MLAYQAGSEAAFDRIVESYSPRIHAFCTRFLGPIPDREDLVQDVFLRVIRAREKYRATARLSTWLYRITYNLALNWHESRRHRLRVVTGEDPADPGAGMDEIGDPNASDPADGMEQEDVVRAVREAIAALPAQQRLALILARYEEMPLAEIGQVLGCSAKAVKSLLHRARTRLRESLAPFLQEDPR